MFQYPTVLILALFLCESSAETDDLLVRRTEYGPIRGVRVRSRADPDVEFLSFQGVPYAKAPLRGLRFQPPVPPEPWDTVKDTDKHRDSCTQLIDQKPGVVKGSEDCLYLSIYVPVKYLVSQNASLPVMYWIHGGAFVFGDSRGYGPDYLMEKPVVLVQVHYRLNVFGFLSAKSKNAEGNVGLKDQLFGLKWVRRNIANFGGNPTSVTIFGESAGGASVQYHLVSERSRGYFQKAISQSGSTLNRWSFQREPIKMFQRLAAGLNIDTSNPEEAVKELQDIDYKTLVLAQYNESVMGNFYPFYSPPFAPSIERKHENSFISESTYLSLETDLYSKVPYMVGYNTEEGSYPYSYIDIGRVKIEEYDRYPERLVPISLNLENRTMETRLALSLIKLFYFKGVPVTDKKRWIDYMGQEEFVRGIRKTVSLMCASLPLYLYRFSYVGNDNGSYTGGVGHHDETQYIFFRADQTDEDKLVRNRAVALWTNFAETGYPTPGRENLLQNVLWPRVTNGNIPEYLEIGADLSVGVAPDETDFLFWEMLFNRFGKPPFYTY